MAVKIGEAFVELEARMTKYEKDLKTANAKLNNFSKSASRHTSNISSSFKSMSSAISLPLLGIAGLALAFRKIIQVTAEQQKAEAQLNAVLKSTKGVAGITAKEIKKLATSIQEASTFGDELVIRSSALLLTFTKIGKDVFPRAQQAIVDMAAAMGTDLQSATIQVGKALNDPILGVSALRRVGVQLGKDQEDLVKKLVKTGETAKAQAIILKELETQFGGTAKASADTLGGAIDQLKNAFGDLLEGVGTGFSDAIIEGIKGLTEALRDAGPFIDKLGESFGSSIDLLLTLVGLMSDLGDIISSITGPALETLLDSITFVNEGLTKLVDTIRGIETEEVHVEVLIDETTAEKKAKRTAQKISKAFQKSQSEAKKFVNAFSISLLSSEEIIAKQQEDNLAKLESFRKRRLITEQEFADTKVAINNQALKQIEELEIQQQEKRMESLSTGLSFAGDIMSQLGEIFQLADQNRLTEIENRRQKRLKEINDTFNLQKQKIIDEEKNQRKRKKKLEDLEADKAKQEEKINRKADKDKARVQRKAFERDKAFKIVGIIIATAQAIMQAFAQLGPIGGAIATALIAALSIAQIALVASAKPPGLQKGGVVEDETLATLGETGTEAVFPLEGVEGQRTRELFANDLINAIANQQAETEPLAAIEPEGQEMTFNLNISIGGDEFFGTITTGIENREILVDEGALVKK
jgi:hypothetical protein